MVSEAMLPRAAVKEVEARLTAAGCPDADFDARELFRLATGRDVRLSDRPLDAAEAEKLEELTVRRAAREPASITRHRGPATLWRKQRNPRL